MQLEPSSVKRWFRLPFVFGVICVCAALALSLGKVSLTTAPDNPQVEDTGNQQSTTAPMSPRQLFERVSPAVVKIIAQDEDEKEIGSGSGFVIRELLDFGKETKMDGKVVRPRFSYAVATNYHVIRSAVHASVHFAAAAEGFVGRVFKEDEEADLAILEVSTSHKVPRAVTLSPDVYPPVGTTVFAIGAPRGLTNTLSTGLISGYRSTEQAGKWIQTTAPISPGSSGGPLLTSEGTVIGVTTASLTEGQNLNFAIPVSELQRLLDDTSFDYFGEGRYLWKGTSIREEERNALSDMQLAAASASMESLKPMEAWIETQVEAGNQLALLFKGHVQYMTDKHGAAIATLTRATRAKPGKHAYLAFHMLGQAHYAREYEYAKKHVGWDGSGFTDPSVFDEAIGAFEAAKSLNPEFSPTFDSLSKCYRLARRYPEALVAAEFLIRLVPRCAEAYSARGDVYEDLERYGSALTDYKEAFALRPTDANACYNVGRMYRVVGQTEKAIEAYERSIQLDDSTVKWMAYHALGRACEDAKKFGMAVGYYEKTLKLWQMMELSDATVNELKARIANCRMQQRGR